MKWWYAVCAALLWFPPPHAAAAVDLNGAAHELARRTVAFAGRAEPVSVTWNNTSSLGAPELAQARAAFETALREAGARSVDTAQTDATITLSENPAQFLLVEEIRKGDDRQVWIAAWSRTAALPAAPAPATLQKKLLWEQEEQILDAAFPGEQMLLLSAFRITWFTFQNGQWIPGTKVELPVPRPLPRDLRGRLRVGGAGVQAFLPGLSCRVVLQPAAVECRQGDDPWVLDSGANFLLLASFAAGRDYFDGRIITQTGARKTVAPFYSAAAVDAGGRQAWLLAMVDGATQIFDASFEPLAEISGWGSDMAGGETRCGGGYPVLAARSGDATDSDTVQPFAIVNRSPVPLAEPVEFSGMVTALWPSGPSSAVVVVHDLQAGKYAAYLITVACRS